MLYFVGEKMNFARNGYIVSDDVSLPTILQYRVRLHNIYYVLKAKICGRENVFTTYFFKGSSLLTALCVQYGMFILRIHLHGIYTLLGDQGH